MNKKEMAERIAEHEVDTFGWCTEETREERIARRFRKLMKSSSYALWEEYKFYFGEKA